jgi:hypothetical protein
VKGHKAQRSEDLSSAASDLLNYKDCKVTITIPNSVYIKKVADDIRDASKAFDECVTGYGWTKVILCEHCQNTGDRKQDEIFCLHWQQWMRLDGFCSMGKKEEAK